MIIAERGNDFEKCPIGPVQAVISNVYDLGLQKTNGQYGESIKRQVMFLWELKHVIKTGEYTGKRFVLTKTYTNSMGEKSNLYKDLKAMIGEKAKAGIDLEKLIDMNVLLNVQENDKGYSTIISIMPMPKEIQWFRPELPKDHCPDWIKKKIGAQIKNDDDFYNGLDPTFSKTFSDGEPLPEAQQDFFSKEF